jgi:hypothetical protein
MTYLILRLQLTSSDAFIHPFDHELLWSGHSSIIDEIVSAGVTPDAVVRCCRFDIQHSFCFVHITLACPLGAALLNSTARFVLSVAAGSISALSRACNATACHTSPSLLLKPSDAIACAAQFVKESTSLFLQSPVLQLLLAPKKSPAKRGSCAHRIPLDA